MIGLVVAPQAYAGVAPGPAGADTATALQRAYASARHLPPGSVAGIRDGSLHTGTAAGTGWAVADFLPSPSAPAEVQAAFQDGASSAVFSQTAGRPWSLVHTGPYGCAQGLPAALATSFALARPASCQTTASAQSGSAARARSALAAPRSVGDTIARIALSQVGVSTTPTENNFNGVDCDSYTTMVGAQSPNADGCGFNANFKLANENEAWCSDFAKWVWQQAGVTAGMDMIDAGSHSFYNWGLAQGETLPVDGGTPVPGDAVVFFPPGAPITQNSFADHVGIVASVNPDGTVNLVNGDFASATAIHVEYDTNVNLTPWSSSIWHKGERWFLVAPPAGAQAPNPVAAIQGPHHAVAGTSLSFQLASPSQAGTTYAWTFGDGRTTNQSGTQVSHVYAEAGTYPVTMTATSSAGTATTRTLDVDVVGTSSTVADAMNPAIWYNPGPLDQYLFLPAASGGGLVTDVWDGASWLQQAVPGTRDAGSGLTALSYPDTNAADAMTPHAYYSSGGTLTQTYLGASGWTTQTLAGHPAPGSAIVATTGTRTAGPAVFSFDAGGRLTESRVVNGSWAASSIPGARTTSPGSLAIADTATGVQVFYLAGPVLMAATSTGFGWITLPVAFDVARRSPLSAVATGSQQAGVFFLDRSGRLVEATRDGFLWTAHVLPGAPASTTSLAATGYLEAPGALGQEVYYLTSSGPAVTYSASGQWQSQALPGTATGILGADAYQWPGQPQRLFLSGAGQQAVDGASAPAGPWTAAPLPTHPATFADSILLYAATPADAAAAQAAASAAGLPATQVTTSFADAWAATLSGNYLVIAVGLAATDALDFNVCGWANPSGGDGGSTPFFPFTGPTNQLPGATAYEEGAAADPSQTPQLATDLAYFATHGALPAGVTSLPGAARPVYACSGQPS